MEPRLLVFCAVIYVLAFLVTTIVHELGHATVSAALGGRPVLHHVYVAHEPLDGARRTIVAAAGPLFSLLQGGACMVALRCAGAMPTAARLLLLWLCIHGLVNFCGYLITTPFVPDADLGRVAAYLELPAVLRWAVLAVGVALVTWIGWWVREPLLAFITVPTSTVPGAAARHVLLAGIGPWLVGSALLALLSWPAPHWISYAYPLLSGCFLIVTLRSIDRVTAPLVSQPVWTEASMWPWVVALVGVVVVFRAVLRPGVRLGARPSLTGTGADRG